MPTAEQFIARAERDLKVIEAIHHALEAMKLVDLAAVELDGETQRLDFSREIIHLRQALRLLGHPADW